MEILVRQSYTPADIEVAKMKAAEFRRNPYTTGSANLDNMIALRKAVILCDSHEGRTNSYVYAMLANHVMTAVMADS